MSDKWHGGKGDQPRKIDKTKFDENFDRIFGKPKDKPEQEKPGDVGMRRVR